MKPPPRLHLAAAAALLLAALCATDARALTIREILEKFGSAQNAMITAAQQNQEGDVLGAADTIRGAIATLEEIRGDLPHPSVAEELGKKLNRYLKKIGGTEKRLGKAAVFVEAGKRTATARLNKLRSGSRAISKIASKIGRPLLSEIDARTAGFHTPGNVVSFQMQLPEGCDDVQVTVQNQPLSRAVDTDTVSVDQDTGVITLTMGDEIGSAYVEVNACGEIARRLLFNKGPKTSGGGGGGDGSFPKNLPAGNYTLTYWATITSTGGGSTNIPETYLGTFPLVGGIKTFRRTLEQAFSAAVAAATQPGCSQRVSYSPFSDNFFTVTYTVTCTSGEASATSTIVFKLARN